MNNKNKNIKTTEKEKWALIYFQVNILYLYVSILMYYFIFFVVNTNKLYI